MRARFPSSAIACALLLASAAGGQGTGRVAQVRGVVFDSVRGQPLRDAFVSITGAPQTTTTDARGRFQFDSIPVGPHVVAVQHAALDSLGFSGLSRRTIVGENDDEVHVAVPSFATLWRRACGSSRPPGDSALVYGTVRDARTKRPVGGASLTMGWIELTARPGRRGRDISQMVIDRHWRAEARTAESGDYVVCGAPLDIAMRMTASTDSAASGIVELPVTGLRVQRRDLYLGAARDGRFETGVVVGLLSDPTGAPFVDALVAINDSLEARSDFEGRVVIAGVPAGTRQVVVRSLAANPVLSVVDVAPDDTSRFALEVPRVTVLATEFVTSMERARMLREELAERRVHYSRYIVDSTEIVGQASMVNVFNGRPNVTVRRRGSDVAIMMPDGRGQACAPEIRIDGVLANDVGQLNMVPPNRVVSLEIYPHAGDVPAEYQRGGVRRQCGLIAVWTKWALRLP